MHDVRALAEAWLAVDPDEETRLELQTIMTAAERGDAGPLEERFAGRLQFGTAGLRGELGAGPMRMNRVTVRRATAGLVRHLLARHPDAAERGLVIGYDARHKSDVFARDTAGVAAALGMRALVMPTARPTPVLAWSVPHLGAVAGVMVTASHNPPRDNGYKVFLDDGSQIVSPVDVEIAAAIDAVDLRGDRGGRGRRPSHRHARRCAGRRLPAGRACGPPAAGAAGRHGRLHPDARRRRRDAPRRVRARPAGLARRSWPSRRCPIPTSRPWPSPTPRSPAPWTCSWRWPPTSARTSRWPTIPTPTGSARPSPRRTAAGGG